jgi:ABC-type lipoprotein export system ATPase subunit
MTMHAMELHAISKSYRRGNEVVAALVDVSLRVNRGEFVLLVGASGSGKTTLLNLICALDQPDHGEIVVAGQNVARLGLAASARFRNRCVGIVFQSYNLLPQLTAAENVLVPMIARGQIDRPRALALLEEVGLKDRVEHRPAQLSGGEQQRVAIARALANDPAVIVADEPTGNLDDGSARLVMELLRQSGPARGTTLLVATHDRHATQAADRTIRLCGGRLAALSA